MVFGQINPKTWSWPSLGLAASRHCVVWWRFQDKPDVKSKGDGFPQIRCTIIIKSWQWKSEKFVTNQTFLSTWWTRLPLPKLYVPPPVPWHAELNHIAQIEMTKRNRGSGDSNIDYLPILLSVLCYSNTNLSFLFVEDILGQRILALKNYILYLVFSKQ